MTKCGATTTVLGIFTPVECNRELGHSADHSGYVDQIDEVLFWPNEGVKPVGLHDGVLYCYGGCGTRYSDFPRDVVLPTALWNRIAVGGPFDQKEPGTEHEGRGGVLCPACIVTRLAALPECTVIFADIERLFDPAAVLAIADEMYQPSGVYFSVPLAKVEEWALKLAEALRGKAIG